MFPTKLQAVLVAAAFALVAGPTQAAPVPKAPALDEKALNESLADVDGRLLLNRKVLKDIKCDIDQLDKIMDALEAAEKKAQLKSNEAMMQIKLNQAGNLNGEAINQLFKDAHEAGEKEFRKATADVVTKLLAPAQRQRLREIDLQSRGHEAFTSASVAKALDLTAKQKEQFVANVKQTEEDAAQAFQKTVAGANGVVTFDFDKVVKEARDAGAARALALLTDEQKAVWKRLAGEPFTHPINRPWGPTSGNVRFGGGFQVFPAQGVKIVPGNVLPALPVPAVDPGN